VTLSIIVLWRTGSRRQSCSRSLA